MNNLKRLKNEFVNVPDLVIKTLKLNLFRSIYIVYLETVTSSDKVNEYVLKDLILKINNHHIGNIENVLAGPHEVKLSKPDEMEYYITSGFVLVLDGNKIFALEAKGNLTRNITTTTVQESVNGPKDAFCKNYQLNIGLIKRRIKTNTLKTENVIVGRKTKTQVGILYLEDVTDINLVNYVKERLLKSDIDGVVDSTEVAHLIDGENKTVFPTMYSSERPDAASSSLLDGKIVIVVDTATFVLIAPAFFIDFINPINDYYSKSINVNFIKLLRILCFLTAMLTPAIYVALVNFNQETIPTKILLNFAVQHEGIPFPTVIEALIMLIVCEILRESDLRFPSNYGSAISILGALIIGQASVSAGIVSPIIIIIVALTFVSSLVFTDIDMVHAIRYFRFLYLLCASILGLYGIILATFYLIITLANIKSLNKSYSLPFAPFDPVYLYKSLFQSQFKKDILRSSYLVNKNYHKKRKMAE